MPASLTKLLKTHRWLIIGLAISIIDILAEWNAIDDPIPTGWSSFHYLINDLLLLVMIFVMIPLDAPREYILALAAKWFGLPVWFDMAGYTEPKRIVMTFIGNLVVCYLYFLLFRWIWKPSNRRTKLARRSPLS